MKRQQLNINHPLMHFENDEQYQIQQSKQDYLRYLVITIRQLNTKLSISSMHLS